MSWRNDQAYDDAVAITKSDTDDNSFHGIYVGTTGNVKVKTQGGTTVTFTGVPAGAIIPVKTQLVYSTDSNMVGFRG
jgi:hypothetical protein